MIHEFNSTVPISVIIVQPSDACIIHRGSYVTIGGFVRYNIFFVEDRPTVPRYNFGFKERGYRFIISDMLWDPPENEEFNIVNKLPTEILSNIFGRLDMHDFFEIVRVCGRFRAIALTSTITGPLRVSLLPLWKLDNYLNAFGDYVRNIEICRTFSTRVPFKLIALHCTNIREIKFDIMAFADHPDTLELRGLIGSVDKAYISTTSFPYIFPPPESKFTSLHLATTIAAPSYHFMHLVDLKLFVKNDMLSNHNPYNILHLNPQIRKLELVGTSLDFGAIPTFTNLQELKIVSGSIKNMYKFPVFATNLKTLSLQLLQHVQVVDILNIIQANNLPVERLHIKAFYLESIANSITQLTNIKFICFDVIVGLMGLSEIFTKCTNLTEIHINNTNVEYIENVLSLDRIIGLRKLTAEFKISRRTLNLPRLGTMANINRMIEEKNIIAQFFFKVFAYPTDVISLELEHVLMQYSKWIRIKYIK